MKNNHALPILVQSERFFLDMAYIFDLLCFIFLSFPSNPYLSALYLQCFGSAFFLTLVLLSVRFGETHSAQLCAEGLPGTIAYLSAPAVLNELEI